MASSRVYVIARHKKSAYLMVNLSTYTIDTEYQTLHQLKGDIDKLIHKARENNSVEYWITKTLGDDVDIAPMFVNAPRNCVLPFAWMNDSNKRDHLWWQG